MGGTSILHGMMYMRGNPKDYNDYAAMGNSGWDYNSVLKYFKKSEDNIDFDTIPEFKDSQVSSLYVAHMLNLYWYLTL